MLRTRIVGLAKYLLLLLTTAVPAGEEWLQLKYDCRHSGDVPDRTVTTPLGLVGTVALTDAVFTSPVVDDKRIYVPDDAAKEAALKAGLGGKGKIDVQRFKGLGEMDAKDLKETTMDPKSRTLIRVTIDEDVPGETGDLVERLMGKKPELRFQYIQENARFVEELDV